VVPVGEVQGAPGADDHGLHLGEVVVVLADGVLAGEAPRVGEHGVRRHVLGRVLAVGLAEVVETLVDVAVLLVLRAAVTIQLVVDLVEAEGGLGRVEFAQGGVDDVAR
jgi:hypothetical protein